MIDGVNHITLAVTNIERSFCFYRDVLGFRPLVKWDGGAYFLISESFWFCLNVDPERIPTPCYTHYAFTVQAKDFEAMSARIIHSGAEIFKDNNSPGDSLYFLDPDGHKLEVHSGGWQDRLQAKKNDPGKWQNVEWYV